MTTSFSERSLSIVSIPVNSYIAEMIGPALLCRFCFLPDHSFIITALIRYSDETTHSFLCDKVLMPSLTMLAIDSVAMNIVLYCLRSLKLRLKREMVTKILSFPRRIVSQIRSQRRSLLTGVDVILSQPRSKIADPNTFKFLNEIYEFLK